MYLSYIYFPSPSAKAMAIEVGLLKKASRDCDMDQWDQLVQFQQMSLCSKFEDCLIVYHGHDLTAAQIHTLVQIYNVTRKMMPGILLHELIEKATDEHNYNPGQRLEAAVEAAKILQKGAA